MARGPVTRSVLGLDPELETVPSKALLQKAFRKRALHCHPDKCPEARETAEAVFKLVTQVHITPIAPSPVHAVPCPWLGGAIQDDAVSPK